MGETEECEENKENKNRITVKKETMGEVGYGSEGKKGEVRGK